MTTVTMLRGICVSVMAVFFASPQSSSALEPSEWQQDLDYVAEKLMTQHANPWDRVHQPDFVRSVSELRARLGTLEDGEVTIELMRLVAQFNDGHTKLLPVGELGFRHWYPLRFHVFSDGLYLTALPDDSMKLRGRKVVRINGREAMAVFDEVSRLFGADNRFGRRSFAFLMSNADVLEQLGVTGTDRVMVLEFDNAGGSNLVRRVEASQDTTHMEWRFWGEYFGPQGGGSQSAFGGPAMGFLEQADPQRPLHLRQRSAYYWEWLEEHQTVYFQLNFMNHQSSRSDLSLDDMWAIALEASNREGGPAERFSLDLRYNFGGDGSLVQGLVSKLLVNYPRALEPGRVFVITSGATFSAGVMMAQEILEHIPAVIVGEPMGAPWNSYGDAESFTLPNSGYQLDISRRWWQLSASDDFRPFIPVQIAAVMSGKEYFGGEDPGLDRILREAAPYPTLDRIVIEEGGTEAEKRYQELMSQWGGLDFWQPVGRMDLEHAADRLILQERFDDAVAAYRLNTWIFPDDWDTWDDLGQACLQAGNNDCARQAYRKALNLNPSNWNSGDQKAALAELGE